MLNQAISVFLIILFIGFAWHNFFHKTLIADLNAKKKHENSKKVKKKD